MSVRYTTVARVTAQLKARIAELEAENNSLRERLARRVDPEPDLSLAPASPPRTRQRTPKA